MDDINENMEYITLDYTNLMQSCGYDLTYLTDLLAKLAGTYNLLISSADGFNKNSFAKKDDVEDAMDRAKDLGKIIDRVTDALEVQALLYIDYIKYKDEFIYANFQFNDIIRSEIEHHVVKREHHKDDDKKD